MSNPPDDPSFNTLAEPETRAPSAAAGAGLLGKLRRALFEENPPVSGGSSTPAVKLGLASAYPQSPSNELEAAALATLRELLSRELSAAAAEFTLQVEALSEIIPDLRTRRRAALSVLAKKGFSNAELCRELQQALAVLVEQQRLFLEKLKLRRDEQAAQATQVEHEFSLATQAASHEIERLEALLQAQREAQKAACVEREQRLAALATADERLSSNELAFSDAYQTIHGEYQTLCEELAQLSAEQF